MAGLRVRQVVHLQADLLLHVVGQQNAILRVEETRAEVGAVRRQMRWILDAQNGPISIFICHNYHSLHYLQEIYCGQARHFLLNNLSKKHKFEFVASEIS